MKKNKLLLFIILFITLFISIGSVKADDDYGISGFGVGVSGSESAACNSSNCANTYPLTINGTKFNTAIYGVRITVVKSDGTTAYYPVNFWATDEMKNAVNNNSNIKRINYNTNVYDSSKKLFNASLGKLDEKSNNYANYIKSLSSSDIEYYLSKIYSGLTLYKAYSNNYYLKFEPIFVYHYSTSSGNDYYFVGTVGEVLKMITSDASSANGTNSYGIPWGWLGAISCGSDVLKNGNANTYCDNYGLDGEPIIFQDNHNVLKNYILTVYQNQKINDKIPYNNDSNIVNKSKKNLYNSVLTGRSGLSVGYVSIKKYYKASSSITITKRTGTPTSNTLEGTACFNLLRKEGKEYKIISVNGQTEFCIKEPFDNTLQSHQVKITNLSAGDYKIREIRIDTSKTNVVYFRQRKEVGNYSIEKGDISVASDNTATSYSFRVDNGNSYFFIAYNHKVVEKGSIKIYKYSYQNGIDGYDFNDLKSYPYTTYFQLFKLNNSGSYSSIGYIYKPANGTNYGDYSGLENGTYFFKEYDIRSDIINVHFKKVSDDTEDAIVETSSVVEINGNKQASSQYFTIDDNNKNAVFRVYNEYDSSTRTCITELNNIINNYCDKDSKICSKENEAIIKFKLKSLYDYELDTYSNDYNLLNNILNYEDNNLDLSGVDCNSIKCELNSDSEDYNYCNSGIINSSKPDDSLISDRVCYITNQNSKHDSTGSFTTDFGANCKISYDYETKFDNEEIYSGGLLWNIPEPGSLNINVFCEGVYYKKNENDLKNYKLDFSNIPSNYIPSSNDFSISWKSNGSDIFQVLNLSDNKTFPSKGPTSVDCDHGYCYATWEDSYEFDILYKVGWYLKKGEGIFSSQDKTDYEFAGYGLPISIEDENDFKIATINFKLFGQDHTADCPYYVKNDILGPPCVGDDCDSGNGDNLIKKYNFDFRIIDTNNPFPGLNGNGDREIGKNWCVKRAVGESLIDENGDSYLLGDVNGDGVINGPINGGECDDDSPYKDTDVCIVAREEFTSMGIRNCDINGDRRCDSGDMLAIAQYLIGKVKEYYDCSSDNVVVQKYIVYAPNSNSTEPMYSFTLTPSDIKKIRTYNKENKYNDFNLECTDDKCLSAFITNLMSGHIRIEGNLSKISEPNNSSCLLDRKEDKWCVNPSNR